MRRITTLVWALTMLLTTGLPAATVHYYRAVPQTGGVAILKTPVEMPCCITGRLSSANAVITVVMFPRLPGEYNASISTFTGPGSVFRAETRMGEGNEGPDLDNSVQPLELLADVECAIIVRATTYVNGSTFAIRIGSFDPFKVAFDGNGGKASTNSMPYTVGGKYGKLPTATRSGYDFKGWYTAATNGVAVDANTQVCLGYPTLYAQWRVNPLVPPGPDTPDPVPVDPTTNTDVVVSNDYSVVFNANGGYGSMPTQTFVYGVAQALTNNVFARTNFLFSGWATTAAGSKVYDNRQVVSNLTRQADGVVTLYAAWKTPADAITNEVVNGVRWYYSTDGRESTLENIVGSNQVAAVSTAVGGSLKLPRTLGGCPVTVIGRRAFYNCRLITALEIPETVQSIGDEAFAGCTSLDTGITIPESVTSLGASVFAGCELLRIVRYLGDMPDADDDLYLKSPDTLISGVLRVRSGWADEEEVEIEEPELPEAEDSEVDDLLGGDDVDFDDNEPATAIRLVLPEDWCNRRIYFLKGVKLYTVELNCKGGRLEAGESKLRYFIPGRPLGELPEPEYLTFGDDDNPLEFAGWYTSATGGELVDAELAVNGNMRLYARWRIGDERSVSSWMETFYDDEFESTSSGTYNGYLYNEAGSNDCEVVGTVTIKLTGSRGGEDGTFGGKATAKVKLRGRGTVSLKGEVDESGTAELTRGEDDDEMALTFTDNGVTGTWGDYAVSGARDRASSKKAMDKRFLASAYARWQGTWSLVLQSDEAEGEGAALADGCYSVFTVTVNGRGKAKVSGVLADGTKVSASANMIFGDGCACVPVLVPLYAGRTGGLSMLLWFGNDEDAPFSVCGLSSWDASRSAHPFTATMDVVAAGKPGAFGAAGATFSLGGGFESETVTYDDSLLPDGVEIAVKGTRWSLPKTDRVKFSSEDGGYEVLAENGNPAGLKLTYSAKDGRFKGSFKLYGVNEDDKSKKSTVTVNGCVIDGTGYGTATLKNVGSAPVSLTEN